MKSLVLVEVGVRPAALDSGESPLLKHDFETIVLVATLGDTLTLMVTFTSVMLTAFVAA